MGEKAPCRDGCGYVRGLMHLPSIGLARRLIMKPHGAAVRLQRVASPRTLITALFRRERGELRAASCVSLLMIAAAHDALVPSHAHERHACVTTDQRHQTSGIGQLTLIASRFEAND
ncbi:hypothetical protein BVV10_05590 [Xanthomonas oryzae pv. oryzae]|nr:hypothetical protein BVV17_05585 [Xanthomonas oryzae pv. oryzae]AUI97160.1 hypothetical protein BVV18_05595 [Xanthomonas oryzae pv. oryzae]AUJ00832.1 hypothetical protein BVV10_05590 [Xanthomonas oryzae pv. oryzae]AUJ04509.1 hypothetical protein BVV19_05600 [Xanthomonas oryzae pv. oryzae]AUJ08177.1 hypothetical protein BVV09_05585 [Xanthomonas oryzae pv. oryzae]